jgi:glucose-6-phosphate dehydrogenase assembly protein OpcA
VTATHLLGLWSAPDVGIGAAEHAIRRIRGGHPVGSLRTAEVSLVALVDDDPAGRRAALVMTDALCTRVPGRYVVVSTAPAAPTGTRTSIKVSLVERDGSPPLCVEQVHIYVNGGALAHIAAIVEPWILPGLPLAAWLPGRLPRRDDPVVATADHVIVDSERIGGPLTEADLAGLGGLSGVDLAWIRLRPWRLLLSDAFTGEDVSSLVRGVEDVAITGRPPWSTLLAGWLMSRLDLPPASIRVVDGEPRAVRLRVRDGDRRAEMVEVDGAGHVRVTTTVGRGATRRRVVQVPDRALLDDLTDALRSPPGRDETWLRAADGALALRSDQQPGARPGAQPDP